MKTNKLALEHYTPFDWECLPCGCKSMCDENGYLIHGVDAE